MSSLEQLYQQVILDHSRARHGAGPLDGVDASSHQVNPTCGDEVTLGVRLTDGRISHLAWEGDGCSISRASLSMLSDLVDGKTTDEAARLYAAMETMMHSRNLGVPDEVLDLLGDAAALEGTSQFANRVKCSLLGWYALRDALAQLGTDLAEGTRA
ncbi:SUF system NifU family Fe-S cluster assembly protein [Actinomyces sp. B33]|uniref:Fe-S cluster assembly sulfur transfer protein SufU n=1 Tax=Actinomyces sp. B33 TaxID=2942131 RepID=UPI002340D571|nr:SUF system NifU family Fe-S cluster assembly protein [Actinomyces sp. B33]MDC4233385.1 SUF system NifU family Fe-S cluster assembly protein [Actinomyces sp. B33]